MAFVSYLKHPHKIAVKQDVFTAHRRGLCCRESSRSWKFGPHFTCTDLRLGRKQNFTENNKPEKSKHIGYELQI
jgi:hypothetical protein